MSSDSERVEIRANKVAVLDDDFCVSLSFGEVQDGSLSYFQLQRQHEYDDQDRELGQDKPYIELDDQKWGCYNGLEGIEIKEGEIDFTISETCKVHMRGAKIVRILLDAPIDKETFNELRNYSTIWGISLRVQES